MRQTPEIKRGINRGRRVYWLSCPKCGSGPERTNLAKANQDKRDHECS